MTSIRWPEWAEEHRDALRKASVIALAKEIYAMRLNGHDTAEQPSWGLEKDFEKAAEYAFKAAEAFQSAMEGWDKK